MMDSRFVDSTRPYEITGIAILMFCAGVWRLFSVRGPRGWGICVFYIVVGIGLLKLYQWARVVTIAVAFLDFALSETALVHGFGQFHPILVLTALIEFLFYAFIVAYLFTSTVRRVFVRPVRESSAFVKKT
jgi:hypothetical protein